MTHIKSIDNTIIFFLEDIKGRFLLGASVALLALMSYSSSMYAENRSLNDNLSDAQHTVISFQHRDEQLLVELQSLHESIKALKTEWAETDATLERMMTR